MEKPRNNRSFRQSAWTSDEDLSAYNGSFSVRLCFQKRARKLHEHLHGNRRSNRLLIATVCRTGHTRATRAIKSRFHYANIVKTSQTTSRVSYGVRIEFTRYYANFACFFTILSRLLSWLHVARKQPQIAKYKV